MTKLILTFFLAVVTAGAFAQSVKNTSYKTASGERILQLEMIVPAKITSVWQLFSTDAGLMKWIAPVAHIELKKNGYIISNYDKNKPLTDSSSIRLPILAYAKNKMIALKVELNDHFAKSARDSDDKLKEVIRLEKVDATHTRIISAMSGFGTGADWDKTYDFFVRGNIYTYEELLKIF